MDSKKNRNGNLELEKGEKFKEKKKQQRKKIIFQNKSEQGKLNNLTIFWFNFQSMIVRKNRQKLDYLFRLTTI